MKLIFENVLETIGNTPVVRLNKLAPPGIDIFVKLEAFNPMGSVKDRLALGVIEDAEKSGALRPGQTVIEATSGNTGIGLAMVCAQKGYPLVVTMSESFSIERRKMMRFLGAKVVLTPAAQKGSGMLAKAVELAAEHGWFLCRQFENEANADAHSRTTAPEILAAFRNRRLDYWVSGFGTGGTLKGVGRVLAKERPDTKIVVCEPDNSPVLASGIPQPKHADGSFAESHPMFRPHLMQGWSPDFIPKLTEDALAMNFVSRVVPVNGADAMRLARELAQKEGIFVGISAGATLAGAMTIAADAPKGTTLLCMLPDTGERYLSTPLFDDISADMNDAELEISKSSPGYRFDVASPAAPPPEAATVVAEDGLRFLADATSDPNHAVVLFALEWCEFCWSVRKMFARYDIPYRAIDLDSVAFQEEDLGGKIRAALKQETGQATIPQVFVSGTHIGGATELFDACKSGELQKLLDSASVPYNTTVCDDPYAFLPKWLQAR
jgi:cysteine synthase A